MNIRTTIYRNQLSLSHEKSLLLSICWIPLCMDSIAYAYTASYLGFKAGIFVHSSSVGDYEEEKPDMRI